MPKPETIDVDCAVSQSSDTETVGYIGDDWVGDIKLETADDPKPQKELDFLAKISNTPSLPPEDDEFLLKINQGNGRETIIINDNNDDDINFMITKTRDVVKITNNDDDNVSFLQQKLQYPRDRSATMLRNKAPTIEMEAKVLEHYPSFTADTSVNETDKNLKPEEVFDRLINQLPPDNDTVYTGHDKKNNKFKVKRETSDKNAMQKLLQPKEKLKKKVQGHMIDVVYCPGKRKSERRPKNPQRNPPDRKIGFMHKRVEKAKRQREEQNK